MKAPRGRGAACQISTLGLMVWQQASATHSHLDFVYNAIQSIKVKPALKDYLLAHAYLGEKFNLIKNSQVS
jgi:hypothetical protein